MCGVAAALANTENGSMMEVEIKLQLGFGGAIAARRWRALRERMHAAGVVTSYTGVAGSVPALFLKLQRAWKGGTGPLGQAEMAAALRATEAPEDIEAGGDGSYTAQKEAPLYAERGLDSHVLDWLLEAGVTAWLQGAPVAVVVAYGVYTL